VRTEHLTSRFFPSTDSTTAATKIWIQLLTGIAPTDGTILTGAGGGTVTASSGAIDCGSTCSDDYDYGTTVTLTAKVLSDATMTDALGRLVAFKGTLPANS